MAMLGEPHNGCHDGPALCAAIGGITWSKMSIRVPACVQSAGVELLLGPCVHAPSRPLWRNPRHDSVVHMSCSVWHVQVFTLKKKKQQKKAVTQRKVAKSNVEA